MHGDNKVFCYQGYWLEKLQDAARGLLISILVGCKVFLALIFTSEMDKLENKCSSQYFIL